MMQNSVVIIKAVKVVRIGYNRIAKTIDCSRRFESAFLIDLAGMGRHYRLEGNSSASDPGRRTTLVSNLVHNHTVFFHDLNGRGDGKKVNYQAYRIDHS